MKVNNNKACFRYFLMVCVLCLSGSCVFAQNKDGNKTDVFCQGRDSFNGGRGVSIRDLREINLPVREQLTVKVGVNRHGTISIQGSDRSDILVRACVQTWGISDEQERAFVALLSE